MYKRQIYGLLGRNGAGKTTLFNCINQDIEIDGGRFYIEDEGRRPVTMSDIGYVLSTPTVPEFLTAREFLKFFIEINQKDIHHLKSIDEYFDIVNIIEEDRDRLLKDFSHGMKNKICLLYTSKNEIIPHGDTQFYVGDQVVMIVDRYRIDEAKEKLAEIFTFS